MTRPDFKKGKEDCMRQCRKYVKNTKQWFKESFACDRLKRRVPISIWLPKYKPRYLLSDLIAGLTVALIIIPQSLALAQIAHLPPHYGLYTGIICSFIYTVFGSAKDVSLGLTPVMAILCFQFCETPVPGNATYVAILSMMTGCLEIFMVIFHIEYLPKFISIPVLSGFLSAVGIIMIWTQVKVISDIPDLPKDLREFAPSVREVFRRIEEFNYWNVIVAAVCVIVMVVLKKLMDVGDNMGKKVDKDTSRGKRVLLATLAFFGAARYAIVVICSAAVGASLVAGGANGTLSVTLVGDTGVADGLPEWRIPNLTLEYDNGTVDTAAIYKRIGGGFFTMPLVSVLEAFIICKALAFKNGYRLDDNQEMLALGIANLLGAFIGAIPVSASHSSTLANDKAGVKTQLGGIFTGLVVILITATLTPYIYYIPTAALAAIIMCEVSAMIDVPFLWTMWKAKKADFFPYLAIFLLAIFDDIEAGIVTGIGLSLGIILISHAHPKILVRHEKMDETADVSGVHHGDEGIVSLTKSREILVFQPPGGLYFTQIETLRDCILNEVHEGIYKRSRGVIRQVEQSRPGYYSVTDLTNANCMGVVIDFNHVYFADTSTIHYVLGWHEDLEKRNIKVVYANLKQHHRAQKTLSKFLDNIQHEPTVEDAIQHIRDTMSKNDHRIEMDTQNGSNTRL